MLAVLILLLIFWSGLNQSGISDLEGDFQEIDAWQNENNTGPVNRVYIVTLNDTLWQEMDTYGSLMPYTKLGTTKVYFFLADTSFPNRIIVGQSPFQAIYRQACVALYEKDRMGTSRLLKFPFRK